MIMKTFDMILLPFVPVAIIFFCISLGFYFLHKEKIYRYPAEGWLSVKDHPIPEDIKNFIATDGKTVTTLYEPKWGPHGGVYFDKYDKTFVKYWRPLPEAPKEDYLKLKKGE